MSLTPQVKMQIALRFLATGDSYKSLQYLFRNSKSAISEFIPYVFDSIYQGLQEYIQIICISSRWFTCLGKDMYNLYKILC